MLKFIWAFSLIISTVYMCLNGNVGGYTAAIGDCLNGTVELCLSLLGIMAFWGGFMEIAERSGLCGVFSKFMSPVIRRLFPEVRCNRAAEKAISMNITANILGLGNAATPLGIEAMKRLKHSDYDGTASDAMITFVIINTASVQIIPVTTAALRAEYGSADPMAIMPAVLLASAGSLAVGLAADRLMRHMKWA